MFSEACPGSDHFGHQPQTLHPTTVLCDPNYWILGKSVLATETMSNRKDFSLHRRSADPAGGSQDRSFLSHSPAHLWRVQCVAGHGGAGDGSGCLTHTMQVNLLLQEMEMELAVGKVEGYVGDRGRAREGQAKQQGIGE